MKKLILFAVMALCPFAAIAQGGTEAMPFIRTSLGPLYTATSGAAVASPDAGAWSSFRSASALTMSESLFNAGVEGRMSGTFPGGSVAAAFKPMDKLGLAIGAMYQSGDILGDYRTSDAIVSAGASFGVTDNLSVGVNARLAKQNLAAGIAYSAVSADFSVLDRISDAVYATAGVSALGGKVTSASGTQYSQPGNAYAGLEFRTEAFDGVINADAMAEYYFSGAYAAAVGAGFTYRESASILFGYRYASQWCVMPSQFSAGAGYNFGPVSLNLSYVRISSQNIIALGVGYTIK